MLGNNLVRKKTLWLALLALMLLDACAPPEVAAKKIQGVTVLQTREVGFDDPLADESFAELRGVGANTVALIPFLHQAGPKADRLEYSDAVSDKQLIQGILRAKAAGLDVVLKPQILIDGSWAGDVNPGTPEGWRNWFASYSEKIVHYAEIAQNQNVSMFVVGTELKQSDTQPYWRGLIESVRRVYHGKVTYAAHNIDGANGFAHWALLDEIGVTLYPALGPSAARSSMQKSIQGVVADLRKVHARYQKPVFVTEIGIRSMVGAQLAPWDWQKQVCDTPANAQLQADVLDLWLEALTPQPWVSGLLVWNWCSDPYAGGRFDTDYTVQNKPAQTVLKCRWAGPCIAEKK